MDNQFDVGMQQDFDNMTYELGRECYVYTRDFDLDSTGQEDENSDASKPVPEVVFLQELDTKHEMVASGQMNVGDVRFQFQSDSIAEEEGYVSPDKGKTLYKIMYFTKVGSQSNNVTTYIKGFGKKLVNR